MKYLDEYRDGAIAAKLGVSERTAARWADYASDAGLLPKAQRGKKRL